MANNHVALRYRSNHGGGGSRSHKSTASDLVYLAPGGKKVATPNDKRVTAEIKNRSEAVRLDFQKKILEKDLMRSRFMIKMDQRQALNAFKLTMENSGKSPKGEAPTGPEDRLHEASPYFTNPGRLSMKRLCKWRAEEKQLQRMLREDEAANPPPDIERDAGYYKEFLEMINSLGLSRADDSQYDEAVLMSDHPVSATKKEEKSALEGHEERKAINLKSTIEQKSITPRPSSTEPVDVFQCLKNESMPRDHQNSTDLPIEREDRPRKPLIRAKSAPCRSTSFSVRQWEKDTVEKYISIASRPASGFTRGRKHRRRVRPSSAPTGTSHTKQSPGCSSRTDLETICEGYSKLQKQFIPLKTLGNSNDQSSSKQTTIFSHSIKKPSAYGKQGKRPQPRIVFHSLDTSKEYRNACSRKGHVQLNKEKEIQQNTKSDDSEIPHKEETTSLSDISTESTKTLFTRNLRIKLRPTFTDYPSEIAERAESNTDRIRPNSKAVEMKPADIDSDASSDDESGQKKCGDVYELHSTKLDVTSSGSRDRDRMGFHRSLMVRSPEGCSFSNTSTNTYTGSDDDQHVSQWRRDLSKEAPPGIFSTRNAVKVNVTLSKVERQRQLETMVKDHTYELKSMVKRERMRKVRQRAKTVVTVRKVDEAARTARAALSRPRTDRDMLRDIV